uniref:helix-turn-helix domain-containing protein n=1 Tax=uncultured Altererythrobacter sp. TaxID=500840 RepID=UPI002604C4D7|nr:helix-turn-helix transcriptional regulator [uncultured Altererythrobacter sp.]
MFDRALKLVRQYHRLNQVQMASKLGISPSFLSEIEKGKKMPSLDLLERYAEIIGIPVSSLIFMAEELQGDQPRMKKTVFDKAFRILEWIADSEQEQGKDNHIYSA